MGQQTGDFLSKLNNAFGNNQAQAGPLLQRPAFTSLDDVKNFITQWGQQIGQTPLQMVNRPNWQQGQPSGYGQGNLPPQASAPPIGQSPSTGLMAAPQGLQNLYSDNRLPEQLADKFTFTGTGGPRPANGVLPPTTSSGTGTPGTVPYGLTVAATHHAPSAPVLARYPSLADIEVGAPKPTKPVRPTRPLGT